MAEATFSVGNFLGGELSQFAQGRFDKPDYRNSLKVCLNAFPAEIGPWVRRPGTQHAGLTRGGTKGRVIKFDFNASASVAPEFTDGFVRFRSGAQLLDANDSQVVIAVSAANPAVVQTTSATNWVTGNTLIFPGASTPLLENRQFTATKIDTTHFSLADAITGANIDGSTLGALAASAKVMRVQELATVYTAGAWSNIRAVQAETIDILLSPNLAPQALTVATLPAPGVNPVFAIGSATLNDGPYLDPFINGVQAAPSAKTGIIGIALGFPTFDVTRAYAAGAFVTASGVNYKSLVDQNVGSTPPSANWTTTSAGAAINNGQGFLGTDVGRLMRLFSEPLLWVAATGYTTGQIVSYNPSGLPGASTYWQAAGATTGNPPGSDLTHWTLMPQGAAIWTWGKITSLTNAIDRALAGSVNIGNMTTNGGLAAAFDGNFSQTGAVACVAVQFGGAFGGNAAFTLDSFVGKNYSGAAAQVIQQATIYPSSDFGFASGTFVEAQTHTVYPISIAGSIFTLRGKATAPAAPNDGTVLGVVNVALSGPGPVTIISNDQTTAWNYVWIEQFTGAQLSSNLGCSGYNFFNVVSEVQFFNPPGTGSSAGVNVEILGPALLYTTPIYTWRLGVFSNTTGWPTCGVYNDGRLYLGGAVGNRFDACVANGIVSSTINFAPTDQYGVVSAASAISYTFNSKGVNKILWMKPDLQGVKAGTQAGEWLIQAPTAGSISPLNITARQVTSHGSANIDPVDTEHTLVFAQRFALKLLEYFPDVFSGKFSAPNLADKTVRTRAGIAELAYTSAVTPIIWGRDALGALFGITYKRDSLASSQPPTFYAWHGHAFGSGRLVESISAGPSVGGNLDALTMVTNDPATNLRHVEVLTDVPDEQSPLTTAWFLDDAVNPTSVSSTATTFTINGLWHLNGKTVQVFAGGLDCGDPGEGKPFSDFVVSNGSVAVTFGDSISAGAGRGLFTAAFAAGLPLSQIVVGFTYNSDGQLVKPIAQADSGARNGPALGKLARAHRYALKLVNTLGLVAGGTFGTLKPVNFKTRPDAPLPALTTFTGISQDTLQDDYFHDGGMCWRVSRPFPANVAALALNLQTMDQ